jgi:hypothetical protein
MLLDILVALCWRMSVEQILDMTKFDQRLEVVSV